MKINECKASTYRKYCEGVYEEISNAVGLTDTVRYLHVYREDDFLEEYRVPYRYLKITEKQFPTETDTCTQMHSHCCRYEKKQFSVRFGINSLEIFLGKKEAKRDISLDNTQTYDTYGTCIMV